MNRFRRHIGTAIILMAVLAISLMLGCCATQRDATEIKHRLAQIEAAQSSSEQLVERMDSLMTAGAEADNQLRNELRYSMGELQDQIAVLLQNYNDLMTRINTLGQQQQVQRVLQPSPGSQTEIATPVTDSVPLTEPTQPGIDCDSTYDESYILVRRNEYDAAIAGFQNFISQCDGHDNIPNAYFWMGQCYYLQERYDDAIAQFEKILSDFPNWPQRSQALFKIARNKEEQGKIAEAKQLFQQVIDEYPGTFDANQAAEKLKEL
jgi:tol-pal system protein YbgF